MNKEMQDLFRELKQYLVQHSPKWDTLCDIEQYIIDLEQENERLNNILIEFEKWLEERIKQKQNSLQFYEGREPREIIKLEKEIPMIKECLEKLQELKEGEK